jgi:hypothetical protein
VAWSPEVDGAALDIEQRGSRQAMGCYSEVSNQAPLTQPIDLVA